MKIQRREFVKTIGYGLAALSPLRLLAGAAPNPTLRICRWRSAGEYIAHTVDPLQLNSFIECESVPIKCASPKFELIHEMTGAVNRKTVRLINDITKEVTDCPAETLLFIGVTISREAGGWAQKFKVAIKMCDAADQKAPGGWNHFFDPRTKNWKRLKGITIRTLNDNRDPYKLADISQIWT